MGLLDYIYLSIVVMFVAFGLFNLWTSANKRRDESIREYLENKEERFRNFETNLK